MISWLASTISNPAVYAILACLALGIVRSRHKKRQKHKKAGQSARKQQLKSIMSTKELEIINVAYENEIKEQEIIAMPEHELDFISTMQQMEFNKQHLLEQYPALQKWINDGYIIDSISPLELRHKDRPYGTE